MMKKVFIPVSILFFPLLLHAQLSGSGTFATPYHGTFEGNPQWNSTNFTNGKVFIDGDVSIDDEELIIEAGMKIIFVSEGADLIITGTGQLTADGTPGSRILFTADDDNDDNYGESSERWGHISFQSMTSTNPQNYPSIIDNCTVEFGQKNSSPSGSIDSYGGGLHAAFSYLAVSYSTFRNNYAGWGGGIMVNSSFSPSFNNCIITNNTAGTSGGGALFYQNTACSVVNCIIEKNTCSGNGGGGGLFLGDYPGDLRFYNCVIASNTNTYNYGNNILFYQNNPSTRPRFYNTIIWGGSSTYSITYWGFTQNSSDFNYCAMLSGAGNYTSCININGSNSAYDGPNFYDPDNLDYSIRVISPCRDKGNSSGAPATDFIGNNRVGTYDIGAYEVQYKGWKTTASSSDWSTAGNWEGGVPGSSDNIVIPAGATYYPVGTSHTINSGRGMVLEPGAKATLNSLTNNGDLRLKSDASNISSFIVSNSGVNAIIDLYLTGGGTKTTYKWHYISTPVTTLPVSTFTTVTPDIVRFYDSRVTTNPVQGWVAQDGWIYSAGTFGGPTFTTLTPGRGYDFYDSNNNLFTFTGQLNNADVAMTLDFAGGANNGFNLLGNPFHSGLDWDYIITHRFPSNTSKGLYFTRNNSVCSYIAGVGSPSDVNGYIPPMQGFFTKTYATGKTIYLADSARTHSLHATYKGTGTIPLVRLLLTGDTLTDETVIRFDEKATAGFDNDFDAPKIFYSSEYPSIFSTAGETAMVINGLPFPETTVEIPVIVNLITDTVYHISATQLEGLENYSVSLIDQVAGYTANLKTTPSVTFSSPPDSIPDRFLLVISDITTVSEKISYPKACFNIFHANGSINIQPLSDDWNNETGSVAILDLAGKRLSGYKDIWFARNSIVSVASPYSKGIYIIVINSGSRKYVGKVVIR